MPSVVDALLAALTLEEKAALTAGADNWSTVPIPRLGIPAVILSDGPAGARGATIDHEPATPSVTIPSGTALGATFDPEIVRDASALVARQAAEKGAGVLLAPTVNLHRHPLWGRNFEAFSEDPLLSAKLGVAYIAGVQHEGLAATVKHFVANEAEHERFTTSSDVDERTLRECYLLPFEYAVRHGKVRALMTSYNRVNGAHVPDAARLVSGVLRDEWGYDGLVMTDWWAMLRTEDAGAAGCDLEMPGPARSFGAALVAAVEDGRVPAAAVEDKARHVLALLDALGLLAGADPAGVAPPPAPVPHEEHPIDRPEDRALCRRAAAESLVLLRNDGVLPLVPATLGRVALIGPRAEHPARLGGGSARVVPHYDLSLVAALGERLGRGIELLHEPAHDEAGIAAARALAADADVAIVVVGTDDEVESEGYDRTTMDLPGHQDALVRAVVAANARTVVVCTTGAPVTMGWAEDAGAVIQSFFGGQEVANALVDVLVGDAEPGGRLPTTIPLRLEHTPAFGNFPGEASHTRYGEGLLIGYRWYEARQLPVAFPFGHGLSYSSFLIDDVALSRTTLPRHGRVALSCRVTNTGERAGTEVVQCYVAPPAGGRAPVGGRLRAPKELRAFEKVRLAPGESATVRFDLGERSFAHYDAADEEWRELEARRPRPAYPTPPPAAHRAVSGWYVEPGSYEICVGRSSAEIAARLPLIVEGGEEPLGRDVLPD